MKSDHQFRQPLRLIAYKWEGADGAARAGESGEIHDWTTHVFQNWGNKEMERNKGKSTG